MQTRDAKLVQSMLDASLHGILLLLPKTDKEGRIIDFEVEAANAAIKAHAGIPHEGITGLPLSRIFPKYKQYGFFDMYTRAIGSGVLQHQELFYMDDRLEGWFDLGVAPQDEFIVVTFVNITDSKRYQQEIERSSAQLHAIMDIAQTGIFIFSPVRDNKGAVTDFRFTLSNKAFASYVGQQPEALVGDLASKWFPGYKLNGLFELYLETYETRKTNRFDFHYDHDDIDVWLDIMSTKLGDEVLVTFTDFTPVKRLQLQIESSINELKQSNANLEEFAYAASHDLQEPLRKIHYFSDRLNSRFREQLGQEGAFMLDRMESATRRMRTLIDDLLAFSQASSNKMQFEEVDTRELVQEVLADLETSIMEKNARVTAGELPRINGSRHQLRQLFQNLISNALKYSRPDRPPVVTLSWRQVRGKESGLEVSPQDGQQFFHLIEVKDNGMGFEQQHAKRIFQIFQRLHGRAEYPGTGVGLAIVQKVMENHKGYIDAQSQPGAGSNFRILLPVA